MSDKVIDMRLWQLRKARPPRFSVDIWENILSEASKSDDEVMRAVVRRSFFREGCRK